MMIVSPFEKSFDPKNAPEPKEVSQYISHLVERAFVDVLPPHTEENIVGYVLEHGDDALTSNYQMSVQILVAEKIGKVGVETKEESEDEVVKSPEERLTEMVFILDMSGSMAGKESDVLGGFNTMIRDQKEEPGRASVSLICFDNEYLERYLCKPIAEVDELSSELYAPRGSTALLDAVGLTVSSVRQRIDLVDISERPDDVVIIIMTDGEENSSKEWKLDRIQDLLKEAEEQDGWDVLYVGAGREAFNGGRSLGLQSASVLCVSTSGDGQQHAYGSVSRGISRKRRSAGRTKSAFTSEDRTAQGHTLEDSSILPK